MNLALCSLETTQNQVKDQSKQIERLTAKSTEHSGQMERVMSTYNDQSQQLNDQSQQIASLTSTVQGLVQQMERMKNQDQYQAMQVNKTTNEAMGGPIKKRAPKVKVKKGKFLNKLLCCVHGGCNKITWFFFIT